MKLKKMNVAGGAFIALLVICAVFQQSFDYGAYIYKSGQSQNLKNLAKSLVGLAQADFNIAKNYAKGQLSQISEVNIDIKFRHLQRLHYLRELASQEEFIAPEVKQEDFPARLTYNGQTENVKISLTGKISRIHLGSPSKWSFQVKVKGDATVAGMKRFGLLVPNSRGYLTDWIAMELMKERGLMGIRIDFVNVTINGKLLGIFYLEERFDKHLIENNRLREGVVFKLGKNVSPYQEVKLMADPEKREQLLLISRMWQSVLTGQIPPDKFFDMHKLAKLFVITDLMNITHPLNKENLRFYFNPVTGLAEPIAREFDNLINSDLSSMKVFFEEPIPFTSHYWQKREVIISSIYKNLDFQKAYIKEMAVVANKNFLDEFLEKHGSRIASFETKLHRYVPHYNLPTHILYANQGYLASKIFPQQSEIIAHFHKKSTATLSVRIENGHCFPIEVTHISVNDSLNLYPNNPLIRMASDQINSDSLCHFSWPPNHSWSDDFKTKLTIHYHIAGLASHPIEVMVGSARDNEEIAKPNAVANLALQRTVKEVLFNKD